MAADKARLGALVPISKSQKTLTFYVVVIPGPGVGPRAFVEIVSREGAVLARLPLALPSVDESGRIAHVAQLSTEALNPGRYTVRLIVTQGGEQETRESVVELSQ